jgi:hypothetical protein
METKGTSLNPKATQTEIQEPFAKNTPLKEPSLPSLKRTVFARDEIEFTSLKITLEYDLEKIPTPERELLKKLHTLLSPSDEKDLFTKETPKQKTEEIEEEREEPPGEYKYAHLWSMK